MPENLRAEQAPQEQARRAEPWEEQVRVPGVRTRGGNQVGFEFDNDSHTSTTPLVDTSRIAKMPRKYQ